MITTIKSSELKTNTDLVCSYCGKDHNIRGLDGNLATKEGIDYVFEKKCSEEWCICIECKKMCDKLGLI